MEDRLWRDTPGASPGAIDVDTHAGRTRTYHWPGDGRPIVLLHGGGTCSVIYAAYAEALAGHDVYAVDIMGDAGRSEPRVRMNSSVDFAEWLDDTLAGLGIDGAVLVGHSLGGFVALSTAAHRPARIGGLVLLDPLGIAPINMARFMMWGLPVLAGSLAPAPMRRWLGRRLRNPLLENKRASRLILHGMVRHAPGFPLFTPLTDDELRAITVPVALLIAAESEPFDPKVLGARAHALLSNVTTQTVPGAGHALAVSHLDVCASSIARMAAR